MRTRIRILSGDPGRSSDSFGLVGIEADLKTQLIYPKFARQYTGPFANTASDFLPIHDRIRPDWFSMESNNEGPDAIEEFRKQGMKIHPVATVGLLTDINRKYWQSMDKNFTVWYLKELKFDQRVWWPKNPGAHMKTLMDQIAMLAEYRTPNGSITYRARRGHDDLFMAFLHTVHMARIFFERE